MTILISIDRAAKRQERIKEQGINFDILKDSVDGLKLDNPKSYLSLRAFYDFDKKKSDHRAITTLGAIGCYMSHENAWKRIIVKDKPEIIIEDDVTIEDKNYLDKVNEWIMSYHNKPRIKWLQYGYLSKDPILYWGAGAYLINPLAAKILLENSRPIEMMPDLYMHHIILKYSWDLEIATPPLFSQYETNNGIFKSLCQDGNNYNDKNKYMY